MSHFYEKAHLARLDGALARIVHDIAAESLRLDAAVSVTREPVPFDGRLDLPYRTIREGERWGKAWDCGWFHVTGETPPGWTGAVALDLNFGGEACLFDAAGCPVYGLTDGSVFDSDYEKNFYPIFPDAAGGEKIDIWADAGANKIDGVTPCIDPGWLDDGDAAALHGRHVAKLARCRVCRWNGAAYGYWRDLLVLRSLLGTLKDRPARRLEVLRIVSGSLDLLGREGYGAAREAVAKAWAPDTDPAAMDVYGVGHAHIDAAWLWPVRETVRKCARTFASQIHLIGSDPDYVFGASQPQLYEFTKTNYPALYAKIRRAVADGRWEVQGGMWVEADCNIPSGESLVRQILIGKNFFRDEFGIDVKNLWLPDVFGYSGNLPQILRRCGIGYFLTQKLSWNFYNRFPHNTFWWRGIDGSAVLAHFPPEDTYNSRALPASLIMHETNNSEAGLVKEGICLFGIGDGGGGPSENFLANARRARHLNGCPRFHFSKAQPVLEKLASYGPGLDTWDGELYFECHRGTYTSQAAVKRWNRRGEEAFRSAEMLLSLAGVGSYPAEEMRRLWKSFLLNQFHDILPGSSIRRVYEEQIPRMREVVDRLAVLKNGAADRLLSPDGDAAAFFNPSSTPYRGEGRLPPGWKGAVYAEGGRPAAAQNEPGTGLFCIVEVPPRSFVTLRRAAVPAPGASVEPRPASGDCLLENGRVRYRFDPGTMALVEIYDKEAGRSLLPAGGRGNRVEIFHDAPPVYDAWEIDEHTLGMRTDGLEIRSVSLVHGPARQGLLAEARIGRSAFRQAVWLQKDEKRLDFVTDVDWRESHKLLRVAFPTNLLAREARFEIQYGHVARPADDNTQWRRAQFESCGRRFADLSERDFGLALLNDSKYGYRAKNGELSLSLLRAPTYPDPVCDRGPQHFVYSILPHTGDLADSDVLTHAAILNQGVDVFAGRAAAGEIPMPIAVEGGVELSVLKRAENEPRLIVRLAELRGRRAEAKISLRPGDRLVETDLMEWERLGEIDTASAVAFSPFSIRTFMIIPG